jgi:hypothetical protein
MVVSFYGLVHSMTLIWALSEEVFGFICAEKNVMMVGRGVQLYGMQYYYFVTGSRWHMGVLYEVLVWSHHLTTSLCLMTICNGMYTEFQNIVDCLNGCRST